MFSNKVLIWEVRQNSLLCLHVYLTCRWLWSQNECVLTWSKASSINVNQPSQLHPTSNNSKPSVLPCLYCLPKKLQALTWNAKTTWLAVMPFSWMTGSSRSPTDSHLFSPLLHNQAPLCRCFPTSRHFVARMGCTAEGFGAEKEMWNERVK